MIYLPIFLRCVITRKVSICWTTMHYLLRLLTTLRFSLFFFTLSNEKKNVYLSMTGSQLLLSYGSFSINVLWMIFQRFNALYLLIQNTLKYDVSIILFLNLNCSEFLR